MTDTKLREHPHVPNRLRSELMRQAGSIGVPAVAAKTGLTPSCLYRIIGDGKATARRTTIERLAKGLDQKDTTNGHSIPVPDSEFAVRVLLPVKRAQRLLAHCELKGITMSAFVGQLIDEILDKEWGVE